MKLLFCKNCQDVIKLILNEKRVCKCGKVGGKYIDSLNAVYFGDMAVPIGFANSSLINAVINQPQKNGMGKDFTAFVIPKICLSYKFIKEEEII